MFLAITIKTVIIFGLKYKNKVLIRYCIKIEKN